MSPPRRRLFGLRFFKSVSGIEVRILRSHWTLKILLRGIFSVKSMFSFYKDVAIFEMKNKSKILRTQYIDRYQHKYICLYMNSCWLSLVLKKPSRRFWMRKQFSVHSKSRQWNVACNIMWIHHLVNFHALTFYYMAILGNDLGFQTCTEQAGTERDKAHISKRFHDLVRFWF